MLQLHVSDQRFYCLLRCNFRSLRVCLCQFTLQLRVIYFALFQVACESCSLIINFWLNLGGTDVNTTPVLYIIYFCAAILSITTWWRHQMETFIALLPICAVTGEFPTQWSVTQSFDVFFDLCLNKRLSKQSWGWWLRRHRVHYDVIVMNIR